MRHVSGPVRRAFLAAVLLAAPACADRAGPSDPSDPSAAAHERRVFPLTSLAHVGPDEALFVVDGIPLGTRAAVPPIGLDEVVAIEVFQGPAATSRYGERARHGLVLIHTRRVLYLPDPVA